MIRIPEEHSRYQIFQKYISLNEITQAWYKEKFWKIGIFEEGIQIQDILFDWEDFSLPQNGKDIWQNQGLTYFSYDAAIRETYNLEKRLPTRQEWKNLIQFLPQDTKLKFLFLTQVLSFPLGGFRCRDNSFFCNFWVDSWYWSSTASDTHAYNLHFRDNYINPNDFDYREIWFLVRLVKKIPVL